MTMSIFTVIWAVMADSFLVFREATNNEGNDQNDPDC